MNEAAVCQIEITRRDPAADPAAARLLAEARAAGAELSELRLAWLYELEPVDTDAAGRLADALLTDRALDRARVVAGRAGTSGAVEAGPDEAVLTVMRRDGVTDPVAYSATVAAQELGVELTRVRTARRIYCRAADGLPSDEALALLEKRLGNPVVDRFLRGAVDLPEPSTGHAAEGPREVPQVVLEGLSDEALLAISREKTLALDLVEMQTVRDHYAGLGRAPTALELETIAQTWSEHCKHKTLTGPIAFVEKDASGNVVREVQWTNLLKQTVFAATAELDLPRCLSVFVDNAGVITFNDELGVAVKVETHNHPSAIEPYGGAGTGIGGVIRDILGTGLGATPIANIDVFCVGDLYAEPQNVPPGSLHPKDLLAGIVDGVRDYGNRMGIPTVSGTVVSEPRYAGNPLVYAGTVGLIPIERIQKKPHPGDWVVTVGGRTGRDGIHGATFSSDALTSESETQSGGAVQIGNPIAEKMLADVLLEVRDKGWLRALTDCGAGGFSSAVGEMAEGLGARVDMALAPLKYAGLEPWEVWISEAQERMVLAVPPEHGPDVIAAFAAEDVEAVKLGTFTDDGKLVVTWGETVTGELDLAFMHDGLPKQSRRAEYTRPALTPATLPQGDLAALLTKVLASPTVCSKEWIVRQYDHEVQGASALKPLVGVRSQGPGDASAVAPIPGSPRGVVIGLGINPRHGDGDPYQMAIGAVDESLRNLVAVGGDPNQAAVLDNFSWGDCRLPDRLGSLVLASEGLRDAALAYKVPFISGKDSLNNDYMLPDGTRVSIPGTMLVTAVVVTDDVGRLISMDLKGADHPLLLVGVTGDHLLGSIAVEVAGGGGGSGFTPEVDLATAPAHLRAVHAAIQGGGVLAAHDLSEGGLAVAAAEMAFAGDVGAELNLTDVPTSSDLDPATVLFSESPTRFLLEVDPARLADVQAALADVPHAVVGKTTTSDRLCVLDVVGDPLLDASLADLEHAWRAPLFDLYSA